MPPEPPAPLPPGSGGGAEGETTTSPSMGGALGWYLFCWVAFPLFFSQIVGLSILFFKTKLR